MPYLDLDLEAQRTAPKPRSRDSHDKKSFVKPNTQRWRWATPEPEEPYTTEDALLGRLSELYNSLCSLDWTMVRVQGEACGHTWNLLPVEEYERIRGDYPIAPPHDCYPEEWIGYGTWWLLFWHLELPQEIRKIALKPDPLMRVIPERTKEEMAVVAKRRYGPKATD